MKKQLQERSSKYTQTDQSDKFQSNSQIEGRSSCGIEAQSENCILQFENLVRRACIINRELIDRLQIQNLYRTNQKQVKSDYSNINHIIEELSRMQNQTQQLLRHTQSPLQITRLRQQKQQINQLKEDLTKQLQNQKLQKNLTEKRKSQEEVKFQQNEEPSILIPQQDISIVSRQSFSKFEAQSKSKNIPFKCNLAKHRIEGEEITWNRFNSRLLLQNISNQSQIRKSHITQSSLSNVQKDMSQLRRRYEAKIIPQTSMQAQYFNVIQGDIYKYLKIHSIE